MFLKILAGIGWTVFCIILVAFFLWLSWAFFRIFRGVLRIVSTPAPTPEQVKVDLTRELGREPTIVEVAAAYQIAVSQHNQSLLGAGTRLGVIWLVLKAWGLGF